MIHRDRVFVPLMPLVVHYPMTLKARGTGCRQIEAHRATEL
jgi:hypothetical protein